MYINEVEMSAHLCRATSFVRWCIKSPCIREVRSAPTSDSSRSPNLFWLPHPYHAMA